MFNCIADIGSMFSLCANTKLAKNLICIDKKRQTQDSVLKHCYIEPFTQHTEQNTHNLLPYFLAILLELPCQVITMNKNQNINYVTVKWREQGPLSGLRIIKAALTIGYNCLKTISIYRTINETGLHP